MKESLLKRLDSYKEQQIASKLRGFRQRIVDILHSQLPSPELQPYFVDINEEGVPFTNYESEPRQVVQIKDIINALYHGEQAFIDLETVELLRDAKYINQAKDIYTLLSHTITNAFKAGHLATHLDIDVLAIFAKEIKGVNDLLRPVFQKLTEGCRLIRMLKHPQDDIALNTLQIKLNNKPTYILFKKELYYFDGKDNIVPVELDDEKYNELKDLFPFENNKSEYASKKALEKITAKTGHTPNAQANDANEFLELVEAYPFSSVAGHWSGIAVDQLKPEGGSFDYHFLVDFGTALPGYIKNFTSYIQEFSPELTSFKPTLDENEIEALQKKASILLNALENLKGNNIFVFAKIFYYVEILRHVIYLSMGILEQMSNLNDSSQEVIRNNLARLKYQLLVPLFALVDRIEDESLMAPGTLSKPLMATIKPFYKLMIDYTSKVVNFSNQGQELLTIEDNKFVELRLVETYQRINQEKETQLKVEEAQAAFVHFYTLLENRQNANQYIINLSKETKKSLADKYKLLQPYFKKIDIDASNDFITALATDKRSWQGALNPLLWTRNSFKNMTAKRLTAIKNKIEDLIKKDIATQQFHIKLNENLIQSIYTEAELKLFPYERKKTNTFVINEATVLQAPTEPGSPYLFGELNTGDNWLINTALVTSNEASDLYKFYDAKLLKLQRAEQAFTEFMALVTPHDPNPLATISPETKKQLSKLYCLFQPYLIDAVYPDPAVVVNQDSLIVESLSEKPLADISVSARVITPNYFITIRNTLSSCFENKRVHWLQRRLSFREIAGEKYRESAQELTLEADFSDGKRIHHVIKHTKYSKMASDLRATLFEYTTLFNEGMRKELVPHPTKSRISGESVPFPELLRTLNKNQALEQGKQVLAIKRIFNVLHHLEKVFVNLEKLNEHSFESEYVANLMKAKGQVDDIINIAKELYKDPFMTVLASDLLAQAQSIYKEISGHSKPYSVAPEVVYVPPTNETIKYTGIWYALNAFMLVPAHIKALSSQKPLTDAQLKPIQQNAKQIVVNIESIIASADSFLYLKLLLKTPLMYRLFCELREKLTEVTTLSHDGVLDHIKEINTDLFARILVETDQWEDKFGLAPGKLSGSMKLLLDEFYKGLVEPLGFQSQKHIDLVSSLDPITKRLDAAKQREQEAIEAQAQNLEHYRTLEEYIRAATVYPNFSTGIGPPSILAQMTKFQLINDFNKIIPLFEENQALIATMTGHIEQSLKIDQLLVEKRNIREEQALQEALQAQKSDNIQEIIEEDDDDIPYDDVNDNNKDKNNDPSLYTTNIIAKLRLLLSHYKENPDNGEYQAHAGTVTTFIKDSERYLRLTTGFGPPSKMSYSFANQLQESYKNLLPLLKEKQELIKSLSGKIEKSPIIDNLLIKVVIKEANEEQDKIIVLEEPKNKNDQIILVELDEKNNPFYTTNVIAKCRLLASYYKGLIKTHRLEEETAQEKIAYLNDLQEKQLLINEQFVVSYTQKTFEKRTDLTLSRLTGLTHFEREYKDVLKEYIESRQQAIIDEAQTSENIVKKVQELVAKDVKRFDLQHYEKYVYLEQIMTSITQFGNYLAQATFEQKAGKAVFENEDTLAAKKLVIQKLKDIASNTHSSVDKRIEQMKKITQSYKEFEGVMVAHSRPNELTFAWLCQKVASFLQLLHLYKPTYIKQYQQLDNTIKTPPDKLCLSRFSIFVTPEPVRNYKLPAAAILVEHAVAPSA